MSSLIDTVKTWISSFEETVDFILVSLDNDLVMTLIDQLQDYESIGRIVLPALIVKDTKGTGIGGESIFLTKYPGRVITSSDFNLDQRPCIIFADFVNSTSITKKGYDYYNDIERQRKYRKYCRGVLMYKLYGGNPPLNGFWLYDKSFESDNGRFVFLKRSVWAEMSQTIPELDFNNTEENRFNITSDVNVSVKWIENLKKYLRHVLPYFLGTTKLLDHFLTDESMIVWTRCFIHPSYNRIYGYEATETLGDTMIKFMFCTYMVSKYKRFTDTELSEYSNDYLSKAHQHYISDDLSLTSFALADWTVVNHTQKTKTDLMETFCGSLFQLAQRINISVGFLVGQNFVTIMAEQFSFQKRMIFGVPKPRVIHYITSLGFRCNTDEPDFLVKETGTYNAKTWSLTMSDRFQKFIYDMFTAGRDIRQLIGLKIDYIPGKRHTDDVENDIYQRIDNILNRAQIDLRFAPKKINKFIPSLIAVDNNLYVLFKEKLAQQFPGYPVEKVIERIQFESVSDDNNNYVMMFVATFDAQPKSLMLRSFTKFVEATQKAGDDYIQEVDIPMQLKNLAQVPMPLESEKVGTLAGFTPYDLACYRCVYSYVMH